MKISFKNFESKVETVVGKSICAEVNVSIFTDISDYNKAKQSDFVTHYLFDFDELFKNGEEMFDRCLKIGVKDNYTDKEQEFVNNFFGFSSAISIMAPQTESVLKPTTAMCNFVERGDPMLTLLYEGYGVGFENVAKTCYFAEDRTLSQMKFTLISVPLFQDEIKNFISYLGNYTYRTFRMNLLERTTIPENQAV